MCIMLVVVPVLSYGGHFQARLNLLVHGNSISNRIDISPKSQVAMVRSAQLHVSNVYRWCLDPQLHSTRHWH